MSAGAFGQPVPPPVACPTCPVCGAPPTPWSVGMRPWFCSNATTCKVLTWNPGNDLDTNLTRVGMLHDPVVCPLGGQPVEDGQDPRCRCMAGAT